METFLNNFAYEVLSVFIVVFFVLIMYFWMQKRFDNQDDGA
jgi:uncharacterized membrane protein